MHGLSEIVAMNKVTAANKLRVEHTLLPGIVRDTLRQLTKQERRGLIGQLLQVLANESP